MFESMFDIIDSSDDNIIDEHEIFCMARYMVSRGELSQEDADKTRKEFKEQYG